MTTTLMEMLKQVEVSLHMMENHVELELFDREVMKLWIEIYSSKDEIEDNDHLYAKYEQIRNLIAQI